MDKLFANVWQRIDDGEQFLGMPWRKERRFCTGATLVDQPPPYCTPKYRLVGVLHVRARATQEKIDGPQSASVASLEKDANVSNNSGVSANAEKRFFIEHGMIHDRVTGKHVSTEPIEFEEGQFDASPTIETCALLNSLAHSAPDLGKDEELVEWLRNEGRARNRRHGPNAPLHKCEQAADRIEALHAEREKLAYHAEQLATYIAQPAVSEKHLASARWHNDQMRAALNTYSPENK